MINFNGWVPEVLWGDPHIGHPKMAHFRGFEGNIDAMDAQTESDYHGVVKSKNTRVLLFGDVMLCHPKRALDLLSRLKGEILLIAGNHDGAKNLKPIRDRFVGVIDYKTFKYEFEGEVFKFVCSHYPMSSWDGMYRGSVMLHGHCHGGSPVIPNRYDVGVDISTIENGKRKYTMRPPLLVRDVCAMVKRDRTRDWHRLVRFEGGVYREYQSPHQDYTGFLEYLHTLIPKDEGLKGLKILSIHLLSPSQEDGAGILSVDP